MENKNDNIFDKKNYGTDIFPIFPNDIQMINSQIGVKTIGEKIIYFNEGGPIYQHDPGDYQSFRYITSQMIELKTVRQVEIIKFFKVSKESVIRWSRIYRAKGAKGFFGTKKVKKSGNVLTAEILIQVQKQLNSGKTVKEIGELLNIKADTIQKGIQSGRLTKPVLGKPLNDIEKTQSQRSLEDSLPAMGVGCTNEEGRMEAIVKKK